MNVKKLLFLLLFVVTVPTILFVAGCDTNKFNEIQRKTEKPGSIFPGTSGPVASQLKLDRTTKKLVISKHGRCRMNCRNITEQEIKDILVNGTINYKKSYLNDARGPTYALEGITDDLQHVRIVFAPKQQHVVVVTVIDLDVEYECHCN